MEAYRARCETALEGLDALELREEDKQTLQSLLMHNIAFQDACLKKGTFTPAELQSFARGLKEDLQKPIWISANSQVGHWFKVLEDWKKTLGDDWDRTYAATNSLSVTRQNNILFTVMAQFMGQKAIGDRLLLFETTEFTTTPDRMLDLLARIVSDRALGREQCGPGGPIPSAGSGLRVWRKSNSKSDRARRTSQMGGPSRHSPKAGVELSRGKRRLLLDSRKAPLMVVSSRGRALGGGLATLLILSVLSLSAQESTTPRANSDAGPAVTKRRRPYEPVRHLPDFFGQVGLTMEQREAIYKIRARHLAKIEELEKQIDEIEALMISEAEQVLTEKQKQALAVRRKAAPGRAPRSSTTPGRDHEPESRR
jgi:hypothetical protein